jgi:hypothetical protein
MLSQLIALPELKIRVHYTQTSMFKKMGLYEIGKSGIRNIVLILAAICFESTFAFALAIVAVVLYDYIYSKRLKYSQKLFSKPTKSQLRFKAIWFDSKWLLLGALGSGLIMQGGFLALGLLTTQDVLGSYFFAFQLVSVFALLLGEAIRKVLMPLFASIKSIEERHKKFCLSLTHCFSVVIPFSLSATIGVGPLIEFIWDAKWSEAIYPSQLMIGTLFLPIVIMLCYSLLEASGKWKLRNVMQVSDGLLLVGSAIIGAFLGGLKVITICIISRRIITGVIQVVYTFTALDIGLKKLMYSFLLPMCISLVMTSVGWFFTLSTEPTKLEQVGISLLVFMISLFVILPFQYPNIYSHFVGMFRKKVL